jgi:hypothetical protein
VPREQTGASRNAPAPATRRVSRRAFSDGITQDRHPSQNIHFFEENCQKQGRFVPQRQKLSAGVKICQSTETDLRDC